MTESLSAHDSNATNTTRRILVAATIVLGGCAAQDVRQTGEAVNAFCAEKYADQRIDAIRTKMLVPISVDQPQPIEILANRQRPNADEKKALSALFEARDACNKFSESRLGAPPGYRAASQDRITAALSDLYAGDITYGDFAKTVLFIGERDKLAREDIERAVRNRERWQAFDPYN